MHNYVHVYIRTRGRGLNIFCNYFLWNIFFITPLPWNMIFQQSGKTDNHGKCGMEKVGYVVMLTILYQ